MHRSAFKLAVILALVAMSSFAHAGYDERESPPDLFCEAGKTAGSNPAFGGKPISLLSGMETFAPSTDLTIGTLFPIRVTRSYNSKTSYDSPLGYGWAINYDKRLYTYADNSVTVRRECGGKRRFTWSVAGYIGQTGDTGTLVQNEDGTFTYTDKNGETEKYDARGRLMSMADAKGNSLAFTYSADTRDSLWGLQPFNLDQNNPLIVAYDYHLSKIEEKDASGSLTGVSVTFAYDLSTGRLNGISDSAGRSVAYGHDSIGNLTTATGPNTNATYGYTDTANKHVLTAIDEGNGQYVNTYDPSGRVTKQTHGTGEIDFTYNVPYQKTTMTTLIKDGSGNLLNTRTRTVEFDTNGMVAKVTDTYGNTTTYIRDSNTWVLAEIKTELSTGITTTTAYTYDSKGNTLTKTEALGTPIEKTVTYTYDPTFNGVETTTVQSVVNLEIVSIVSNSYDPANDNLLSTTESGLRGDGTPYSYTTTYTYNANGKIATIDGPRTDVNDITTYTYDPVTGFLTAMTQPVIGTTIYSNHDVLGNPQTVTDPNGNSTIYTYDTIGRVTTVRAPGDTNSSQYFYVAGGCQSCGGANKIDHITLPERNTIWYTYDAMGNLSSITDSLNNTINYTYDSEGNKLTEQIKDPSGALQKTLSYSYDALNRLTKITNPDSSYTQYAYDSHGNRTSLRTPNAQLTTYAYDALSRLTSVTQPGTVVIGYGYNANNNLKAVTNANNNTTTYKYDDKGRVYQVISPDTGTTTYSYDPAGNMVSKTDAKGVTSSNIYDALNRLTNINFPSDPAVVYAYDACPNGKGHLCSMTDAAGITVYEYTPKGQVKKETKTIDGNQYVTQYSYDMNMNLKTVMYPSGRVVSYTLSNDKVIAVLNDAANLATNIQYKPFGGMSLLTYGNGLAGTIGYDNQYRVTGITAGTVMNLSFSQYDANGNITAINNVLDPTKNKSFAYDALDRLTSGTGSWGSLSWTYDGVGNRLTEGANSYTYTPGTNRLSSANGLSYDFDNNGNTTAEGARAFTFNQKRRLIRVTDAGVTKGEYTYNGKGQRAKKTVSGITTVFHYNLDDQIIAESDASGNITAEYIYLNSAPLAKIAGGNVFFFHNDDRDTPQKMTDSTGAVVWSAEYKPFGEVTIDPSSTITNNIRSRGEYYDAETGLLYNYFRDRNPVDGHYLEADPIGILGGTNHLYATLGNNPINFIDPLGLARSGGESTSYFWGDCSADETAECAASCAEQNKEIESCKWKYSFRNTIRNGEVVPAIYKLPNGMSCSCKDKEDPPQCKPIPFIIPGGAPGPIGGPAPAGACFVSGTLVHTSTGVKPIEQIQLGDVVLAWNEATSQNEFRRVVSLIVGIRRDMVKLYLESEDAPLIASTNHKFFVQGKGWVMASDLAVGDILLDKNSMPVRVKKAEKVLCPDEVKVYNLEVEGLHDYYAGPTGVLTHNKGLKDPW